MTVELDGKTMTNSEAIAIALIREARLGNVRAFVEVRNTVGEMPMASVEVQTPTIPQETYDTVRRILLGED